MVQPPKPSAFQIGLRELLMLTALLAVTWWQCSTWPVTYQVVGLQVPLHGPFVPPDKIAPAMFQRPPTPLETLTRGLVWTVGVVAIWIAVRNALRFVRPR